jgi:hypothetical protein
VAADQQRNTTDNSEAAVDEAPSKRDTSELASDEGQGDDSGTSDEAEGNNPLVSDRIDIGTDKTDGDNEASKC